MTDEWISPYADSDDEVRGAVLGEIEDGVATFDIEDFHIKSGGAFRKTLVAEAFTDAGNVPDGYKQRGLTAFRVVPPEEGEFSVESYDHFTGRTEDQQHVLGVTYDSTIDDRFQAYLDEI